MHLTGGQYKGIKLTSPKGARPTLSVVRESVFNILNSKFESFEGLKFLDCFSGSGIMALEAHSRGFDVLAFEKNPAVFKTTKENFEKLKISNKLLIKDINFAIKKLENFDVIYIDPPWDMDYNGILNSAVEKLNSGGVIICEHQKNVEIKAPNGFNHQEKKYGRAILSILSTL